MKLSDLKTKIDVNRALWIVGGIAFLFIAYFLVWFNSRNIEISNEPGRGPASPLTGLACPGHERRPIAVMLASDPVARPLSGISQADMVVEMPVTPNGVTRLMALFQCETPTEIGSVRSARAEFVPLAAGWNALYAHWGGEANALAQLKTDVLDNIDALIYENTAFFRKANIRAPHNGFTTLDLLFATAKRLKYALESEVPIGYPHSTSGGSKNLSNLIQTIPIEYAPPYDVEWRYDAASQTYRRFRNETPEIDKNTGDQVSAGVVIILATTFTPLNKDYVSASLAGPGQAQIYQRGTVTTATWHKDSQQLASKLTFLDRSGKELGFQPGRIWIEIVDSASVSP